MESGAHAHNPHVVLVTGGAGFIGSRFVRHLLAADPDVRVITLDKLTYAGHRRNLRQVETRYPSRHQLVHGDICDGMLVRRLFSTEKIDTVVHLAAESHVDRSIDRPAAFIQTNVIGTVILLEAAREAWGKREDVRFHHVSTDEVYGSADDDGMFTELSRYAPSSPYSASKAGSDHLVRAWHLTYGLPVTISNASNNYGPYQFPEKLIPLLISKCMRGEALPIYGDGRHVRDWLHVDDHCRALEAIVRRGRSGQTYNVGGGNRCTNLDLARLICRIMDELRPRQDGARHDGNITFVTDRPAHDRRYAVDAGRLQTELGWEPTIDFEDGLRQTVQWYLTHQEWIDAVTRGRYDGRRLGMYATVFGEKPPETT